MAQNQPSLFERNPEATIYVGQLDPKVTTEILWELFSQCGIVVNVHLPKDKIMTEHQGYGFVEFKSEEDADYAIKIMHMVNLFGKHIKVNKASQDKKISEVGANIFVGNLDKDVDEKLLYETFQSFGTILSTRIARDPESGEPKGYGFINYDNFDSSDNAIASMNNQYFCNKVIHVSYAYKKDTKGERHGSVAERILAQNRPVQQTKSTYNMQMHSHGPHPPTQQHHRPQQTLPMPEGIMHQQFSNLNLPMSQNLPLPNFPQMPNLMAPPNFSLMNQGLPFNQSKMVSNLMNPILNPNSNINLLNLGVPNLLNPVSNSEMGQSRPQLNLPPLPNLSNVQQIQK